MKTLSFGIDVCDWCFDEVSAPHAETLEVLQQVINPPGDYRYFYEWIYRPVFANPQFHAALTARRELNDALLDQARGPAVTIELKFSGEEGSLTLCARHVQELLTGIQAIKQEQPT